MPIKNNNLALIINLETTTKNCSVSLAKDGKVISVKEINEGGYSHAEKLHILIEQVCDEQSVKLSQLNAIAVSKGPGSYTGLRIGVSAAKGLCFGLDIPLISVDTLKSLAISSNKSDGFIIPMLDARRMEVYSAVFDENYILKEGIKANIIDENSFSEYISKGKVYILGDGGEKCKDVLKHENIVFLDGFFPSSKQMAEMSFLKFENNDFEDVAYFEPFYLKNFVPTAAKKKK